MSNEAEEAALDALGLTDSALMAPPEEPPIDETPTDVPPVEDPPPVVDDPPGFLSYEQWIEEGKDPDLYKGRKAFEAEYERIQDNKELKTLLKETQATLQSVASMSEKNKREALANQKQELEARFQEQKSSGDVDGALETKEQITAVEEAEKDVPQTDTRPKTHPVIQGFIDDNPILSQDSETYSQDLYDDMASLQAVEVNKLSTHGGADLSENQVKACMQRAFDKAKTLHPELFQSPRNNRQGQGRNTKQGAGAVGGDLRKQLESLRVVGHNEADTDAAVSMYDMLKEEDPSGKQADIYATNFLKGVQQ